MTEYRWVEGRSERRFGEIAAEFVRLKVDVMVVEGTVATRLTRWDSLPQTSEIERN